MANALSFGEGPLVLRLTHAMIGRFGDNAFAVARAWERRCEEAGDDKKARLLKEIQQNLAGRHLVDLVV